MISVDLLPKRYREAKALERFFFLTSLVLAVCLAAMVSLQATITTKTEMYRLETKKLQAVAEQYRQVNSRFKELREAEKQLRHRLDLATPLVNKKESILPYLNYFSGQLPENIWLTSLELGLDGEMYLQGKALEYTDVAAFIKWLEEDRDLLVTLEGSTKEDDLVVFSLKAATWWGGTKIQ
ncbi:MAG: PilN domain-containing protein [Firmicutes bacterium]|nr:PilN domain-containing protein [Bacillota bacterium]